MVFFLFSGYFDEQVEADVVKLKVRWLVICAVVRMIIIILAILQSRWGRDGLVVSALV